MVQDVWSIAIQFDRMPLGRKPDRSEARLAEYVLLFLCHSFVKRVAMFLSMRPAGRSLATHANTYVVYSMPNNRLKICSNEARLYQRKRFVGLRVCWYFVDCGRHLAKRLSANRHLINWHSVKRHPKDILGHTLFRQM